MKKKKKIHTKRVELIALTAPRMHENRRNVDVRSIYCKKKIKKRNKSSLCIRGQIK